MCVCVCVCVCERARARVRACCVCVCVTSTRGRRFLQSKSNAELDTRCRNGSLLDEKDSDGNTLLHYCVKWRNLEAAKVLYSVSVRHSFPFCACNISCPPALTCKYLQQLHTHFLNTACLAARDRSGRGERDGEDSVRRSGMYSRCQTLTCACCMCL